MLTKKPVITILFAALLATLFVSFPSKTPTLLTSGTVEAVYIEDASQVALKLQNDQQLYYLSPVLEKGLTPESLRDTFEGKAVQIQYVRQRSSLAPFDRRHSVAKVNVNNTVYFSPDSFLEKLLDN